MIRILGIDPGSLFTGYGVVDNDGQNLKHVGSGCIRTEGREFPERLREIFFGIAAVMAEFTPQELAVEKAFVHRMPTAPLNSVRRAPLPSAVRWARNCLCMNTRRGP